MGMKTLRHFLRFLVGYDGPESQVTSRELDLLCSYAQGAETVCEIGCFEGKTTAALGQVAAGTVYTVDPFFRGRIGVCYSEIIAHLYCKRMGVTNVHFVRGFSSDVAQTFAVPIDFLFVDADHRYEAIKQDWDAWVPKMRAGGIVALHDCKFAQNSPDPVGSFRFYETDIPMFSNVEEVASVDSLVVLRIH